jgi:hypothetical protein
LPKLRRQRVSTPLLIIDDRLLNSDLAHLSCRGCASGCPNATCCDYSSVHESAVRV